MPLNIVIMFDLPLEGCLCFDEISEISERILKEKKNQISQIKAAKGTNIMGKVSLMNCGITGSRQEKKKK